MLNFYHKIIDHFPFSFNLVKFCQKQVEHYGAQYLTFGIFAVLNYLVPYFMWSSQPDNYENYDLVIIQRTFSGILCFILIIKDHWPDSLKKYLPLYWYFTLLYCLPFMTSFLFLYNSASTLWLINLSLSLFLLAILVDWRSFLIIYTLGSLLGYAFYTNFYPNNDLKAIFFRGPHDDTLFITIYIAFFAIVIGLLFSRHKDYIQQQVIAMLEDKVAERTAHLEEALLTKKEFLNNLSHEIRTPIHGIANFSEILYEDWDKLSDDKKKELSQKIYSSVDRLFDFINNILDMAKFEANKTLLNLQKHNIINIAQNVIDECEALKLAKLLNITITNNVKDPYVICDAVKIGQVFRNLIVNAIKFTSEGSIEIIFKNSMVMINNKRRKVMTISIIDTGIGIPENELESVFDPFTQSSLTKTRAGGTGLGLSICKKIIESHHGKIWADHNNKGGAILNFTLPV